MRHQPHQRHRRVGFLGIGLITAAGLASLAGVSRGTTPTRPTEDSYRAFLEWEAGEWDTDIMVVTPDGSAVTYGGEQVDVLGCCGGWLITDLRITSEGAPPYEGHGVLGYDPEKGKLVGIWVDLKTTWLATAEGTLSPDGQTLTLEVAGRNPMTGMPLVMEYVTKKMAKNRRRLEVFMPLGDGERMLVARIESRRRPESKDEPRKQGH